ncbi:aminotransferase class I/II-fold pyridoxal phosphate-dependent enzyme [Metallosphaera cuprina]|uniref:Aminotransferase n=1 Tax=Metallosphaera cuprina (strain Ar-4) TaxID=1006006 RepID=F4FY97_METCR|nr:histidinol-phosphate transaminase [Metallosphaera cuprina]AEB94216.1 L-threonine O-3-phosphate decarboxylase [Metallosphaera cuprina Ar-4]
MMHGGLSWSHGKPPTIRDFSVNLNPLGVPSFIEELIYEAVKVKAYRFYPDDYRDLKYKIAEIYNVDPEMIGVFNGASEAISLLGRGFFVPEPNYQEYYRSNVYLAEEGEEFRYPLQGDKLIVSHPNNPTGAALKEQEVTLYLEQGKFLVIDQSFSDISLVPSFVNLVKEFPNLLIVSSFTKSFSVPGLRLGFTIGNESKVIEKRSIPWRINSIAYYVFANLDVREVRSFFEMSRNTLGKILDNIKRISGIKFYKSFAPFILAESSIASNELNKKLLLKGFYVRDCANFVGLRSTHFRFSLRPDVNELLEVIDDILRNRNPEM